MRYRIGTRIVLASFLWSALFGASSLWAADNSAKSTASSGNDAAAQSSDQQADPLKRQLSPQEKKEQQKLLHQEMDRSYKKWLDEDVRWIITDQERAAFKRLSNDEERDAFIEQFWARRDPTPDTPENEYKEEHYRRIAYANEHFAAGLPGWMTDRGRVYIMYGAPTETDAHPSGGYYQRPEIEGGGTTSTFPFEIWTYDNMEGIGPNIEIEFVDTCNCGDYHMTVDRGEKDALAHTSMGLTDNESADSNGPKYQRWAGGIETLGNGALSSQTQGREFDRLEQYAKLQAPPVVKFKDLEEIVTHKINYNLLPFEVRTDFVKVTSDTVLVPVTVQIKNKDITFATKDGVARGVVNIFGRVTTLTGRIAQTFEDTVHQDTPQELLPQTTELSSVYWKALPLKPGRYRVDIVLKDLNGDRVGTWSKGIIVPDFGDDRLTASTLILADKMEKVPSKSVGSGEFVLGSTFVRPRVEPGNGQPASFTRDQRLNFWMQVYNLGIDDKTKKNSAEIEYNIVSAATNKPVVQTTETGAQLGANADQLTLEKSMSLASLQPGLYRVTIKVSDNVTKQTIAPTASFLVE